MCGECLRRPPTYEQVIAPWRYAFPLDSLINRFKHQAAWPLGRLLGELLAEHLRQRYAEGLPRPVRLLPVPLALRRERRRGFNQARLLADWLAGELRLRCAPHLLRRVLDTPAQQGLDAALRRRNLRHAFALAPGKEFAVCTWRWSTTCSPPAPPPNASPACCAGRARRGSTSIAWRARRSPADLG